MKLDSIQTKVFRIGNLRVRLTDIVFAAVFCAAAAYFIVTAPYGVTVCDETQYLYVDYRLMQGDKMFSDLWIAVSGYPYFTYLPFRLFYLICGGIDGLALCMRYLFVGIKMILFLYIYLSLRREGLWAVLAGVLYIGTNISGIKTMDYYSICSDAILLSGIFLFVKKTDKPAKYIFAGFLFSCAVLAEPIIAVVWFAYGIIDFVRFIIEKRGKISFPASDLMLPVKAWRHFNIGVLISVFVFLVLSAAFFTGCNLKEMFFGLKTSLEYMTGGYIAGQSLLMIRLSKLLTYADLYGWGFSVAFVAVFFAGVLLHRYTKKYEKLFFVLLTVLYVSMSVCLIAQPMHAVGDARGESTSHPFLLPVLSFAAAVYTKNKNKKMFAFLILTMAVSFATDCYSNNTFGSVLLPGSIPAVLLLRDYVYEQKAQDNAIFRQKGKMRSSTAENRMKKRFLAVLCALLVFVPSFEICHYIYMARMFETEHLFLHSDAPVNKKIARGILKGIVTTSEVAENYEKAATDAESLRDLCENCLYVVDYDTGVCLNAGARSSVPFLHVFTDHWNLENIWWTRHPERRPDVVYIPFFSLSYIYYSAETPEEKLAYFESKARIEVTVGKIGYIVKINQWY